MDSTAESRTREREWLQRTLGHTNTITNSSGLRIYIPMMEYTSINNCSMPIIKVEWLLNRRQSRSKC